MDFKLDQEQQAVVDNVRRFVREEIVPLEMDLDPDADELPHEDFKRLSDKVRAMGLYALDVPEEFGGPGLDLVTRVAMAFEMSQHRAGLYAPCYGTFGGVGLLHLFAGTEEQKKKYLEPLLRGELTSFFALTEPSGGSDPARAIETRAVQDGDEWVLNGSKLYISGADKADFGITFARTGSEKSRDNITCFIIETDWPGFHVRRVVHTMRSSHYATELQYENLRVPAANVLGEVGKGFALASGSLLRERLPYAALSLGPAIRAQEMCLQWIKDRHVFGAPLASKQAIQWMIVDNEMDIRQARWVVLDAAQKADRGEPFRMEAAMAKLAATEAAGRVVDRAIQIHGGAGVTKDFPFERWYRELRIRRIGEGPSEVQRLIMARELIGGSFK